jgi:hypothetical protein
VSIIIVKIDLFKGVKRILKHPALLLMATWNKIDHPGKPLSLSFSLNDHLKVTTLRGLSIISSPVALDTNKNRPIAAQTI